MEIEPKTINHNAQPIGDLLSTTKNQPQAKRSRFNPCEICKIRPADGLVGRLCSVCERKIRFDMMPVEEQEALLSSVIPKRFINARITDLSSTLQKELTSNIDSGVLLWGGTGRGKTHAMATLIRKYLSDGFLVRRILYEKLCLKLRDTYNKNAHETEWSIIEPFLECDILFIEDVGTVKSIGEQESDFSLKTFCLLLDTRWESCLPTYVTTNKSPENLTRSFDERIGDRLKTYKVFKLAGESKRRSGNIQGKDRKKDA